jgi:heme/copper-type cytochrome/quinol oxidase subunit 3
MPESSEPNPPTTPQPRPTDRPPLPNPKRTGTFGMLLILASLGMLFAASVIGYAVIRLRIANPPIDPGTGEPGRPALPLGSIDLPTILWLSTALMVAASITLHWAGISVNIERQRNFRRGMVLTLVLGVMFLAVQIPAMVDLVRSQALETSVRLYNLVLVLVVLHGLHVIGGLIPLGVLTRNAFTGKYDHEHNHPITLFALYWHFLLVVWVIMFSLMSFLR